MTKIRFLGVAVLGLLILAPEAMARGGAARGGVRGAMVGGVVGGSEGAKTGAKVGVVAGATRGVAERTADRRAMDSESQSRTEYESTTEYQSAQHSDFSEAPPDLLITSPSDKSATAGGEAIIRKDGKPILGITYPSDWKQKAADSSVSAISKKGEAWSVIATLDGVNEKQAAINKIKQGLEKYLKEIDYDDLTKTENGALLIAGTGKGKKGETDVVFSAAIFDAAPGQLAGTAFIVDKSLDDRFKEAVGYIVKTIRVEKDFTHEVAKPISPNN